MKHSSDFGEWAITLDDSQVVTRLSLPAMEGLKAVVPSGDFFRYFTGFVPNSTYTFSLFDFEGPRH